MSSPVIIDSDGWLKTQLQLILVSIFVTGICCKVGTIYIITNQAGPLNVISLSLEVSNANAQVSQLIGELSGQLLDESLVVVVVSSIGLSHSLCNNLSHLITAQILVTLESAVSGIAVYNAVLYQLSNSIVCPMVCRNIGENAAGGRGNHGCRV